MTITEKDCVVGIEYEVREAGKKDIIDSNKGTGRPLEFIMGHGHIIPGLEEVLIGMGENETSNVIVPAEKAYGKVKDNAVQSVPIDEFQGIELYKGQRLYGRGENGQIVEVTVKDFDDKKVQIDFNHPLAGKDLMFSLRVVSTREATKDEIESGQVGGHREHVSCGCGEGHCS